MRKICAITANRADFSRIETILEEISNHPDLELQLIVMGSHLLEKNGRTINNIRKKGFHINSEINMEIAGETPETMTKSVGLAIMELSSALSHLKPDIVIAPVDRFESMAMGISAAMMNIHVAHIQGGEVTGTIDESIRHALTKMSHLHFVSTEASKERVIRLGEVEDMVFNVGCPATDLLLRAPVYNREKTIEKVNTYITTNTKMDSKKSYLFLLQHPVTTESKNAKHHITEIMKALEMRDEQIIALWPNIDAGSDAISIMLRQFLTWPVFRKRLFIFKHIPSDVFVNILRNTACQIGNSSSGIREACYFGTPVVNVGTRQNNRERGQNVVDVGYDSNEIDVAVRTQIIKKRYPNEMIYGDGTAGKQIVAKLATIKLPPIQKTITY